MSKSKYPEHTAIVRQIIDEEIAAKGRVCKLYLVDQVKNRIHPTQVYNRIWQTARETNDGLENLHRGAKRIVADALLSLKSGFAIDRDGWISSRDTLTVEQWAEVRQATCQAFQTLGNCRSSSGGGSVAKAFEHFIGLLDICDNETKRLRALEQNRYKATDSTKDT